MLLKELLEMVSLTEVSQGSMMMHGALAGATANYIRYKMALER